MRLKAADLGASLKQGLAPVYLVSGDDALLLQEACDAVVEAARGAGFGERSVLHAERGFEWNDLLQDAASMSLFAERRIIDLRVAAGGFDRAASEALRRYAQAPPDDTLLLIRAPRLDGKQQKSAWFRALEQAGVVVQVWPLTPHELPRWLAGRLRSAGLTLEDDALERLAERVEGNLLAAVQEIEKLKLAGLETPVSAPALMEVLEDAARFESFDLVDGTLAGDGRRVARVLATLREEGVAVQAVLGALTWQLRQIADGGYLPASRQRLVGGFLERIGGAGAVDAILAECALVDAQSKGQLAGEPWESLELLLLRLCGVKSLRHLHQQAVKY